MPAEVADKLAVLQRRAGAARPRSPARPATAGSLPELHVGVQPLHHPRTYLRTQWSAVLRRAVRLGHHLHRLALLSQAHQQQGVARQAVAYRVVHRVPPPLFGALRPHARRPAAAQQRPRLFHAVDRRAVRVAQRLQRPSAKRSGSRCVSRQSVTCAR